jgi:hypothetical protein
MARLLMIVALLLSLTAPAAARTVIELERGVALILAAVNLPTAAGGTISFKTCADCAYKTHRTTDATTYEANGRALPLPDFLRVVEEIYARAGAAEDDAVVAVFLGIDSERVTRVTLRY